MNFQRRLIPLNPKETTQIKTTIKKIWKTNSEVRLQMNMEFISFYLNIKWSLERELQIQCVVDIFRDLNGEKTY